MLPKQSLRTPSVNSWIAAHGSIRDSLVWFLPTTPVQVQPYVNWTSAQKNELQQAFVKAWHNQPSGLDKIPANLAPYTSDGFPVTIMSTEFTWKYYLAHVAQCLALEIGKRLTWSILDYTPEELAVLLDSRTFLMKDVNLDAYRIIGDTSGGYTVAPPDYILNFLHQINFLEPYNQRQIPAPWPVLKLPVSGQRVAIYRLFDWCRHNLFHFAGGFTSENMLKHWQYFGWPPIARVIEGTIAGSYPLMHWTGGCLGTVGFLVGVLRSVNIPVRNVWAGGHSLPYFVHEHAYLTHGDDLYSTLVAGKTREAPFPYPSSKLLITQTRFTELFGAGVTPDGKNVGRRPFELAIEYLPYRLLSYYCSDKKANLSHASGSVFGTMGYFFSLAELEQQQLWERLEAKLISLGGCDAIPVY